LGGSWFQPIETKKKYSQDPISMEKSWAWWYVPIIPAVHIGLSKKQCPISKISRAKRPGVVA
jgi:hypothetical protein